PLQYSWPVGNGVTWDYKSVVQARKTKDAKWQVYFDPATLHPDLTATDKVKIKHIAADRGNILDGTGAPLTTKQRIITIGVRPGEVTDAEGTVRVLTAAFQSIKADIGDIALTDLPQKIKAGGTAPIDVISLREPVYNKIRSTIHELNGLYFPDSYRMLTPTTTFGKALLGRARDGTAELMKHNLGKSQNR